MDTLNNCKKFCLVVMFGGVVLSGSSQPPNVSLARNVRVIILSTSVATSAGRGEWGFSAFVEVDGKTILFDTGRFPETVLSNSRELGVDLSAIEEVILSHHHDDHVGGYMTLRQAGAKSNLNSLRRVHVGEGFFLNRIQANNQVSPAVVKLRAMASGSESDFLIHSAPSEIIPGAWVSGPVPRVSGEENWNSAGKYIDEFGTVHADMIPEDQGLFIPTERGTIIITGCGHAGIMNLVSLSKHLFNNAPIYAIIGGLHLTAQTEDQLNKTLGDLKMLKVQNFIGAHCSGIDQTLKVNAALGLGQEQGKIANIGTAFEYHSK
jgi:7,8-dihydropterin-6-yl-methyl-4-(beta-D-ribofuranosyl)aminobenzene 5'-phosphate synthase